MKKELRFALLILLLAVMVGGFFMDSKMQISTGAHNLNQIIIVVVTYLLVWQWISYDEFARNQKKLDLKQAHNAYRRTYLVKETMYARDEWSEGGMDGGELAAAATSRAEEPRHSIVWVEGSTPNQRLVETAQENKN